MELATEFAACGAKVIIAALEKEAVEKVVADFQAAGMDVTGFAVDVTSDEDVQELAINICEKTDGPRQNRVLRR